MGQAQGQTPAGEPPLHRTEGYPAILDGGTFTASRAAFRKNGKTDTQSRAASPQVGKPSALCRLRAALHRMGGRNRQSDTLYLKCVQCGAVITMRDEVLLDEIARQTAEQERPERISYQLRDGRASHQRHQPGRSTRTIHREIRLP